MWNLDRYRFVPGSVETIGGIYEHVAKSERRNQIIQRSLDRRRLRRLGRGNPVTVLDVARHFSLLPVGLRRRLVTLHCSVDLHAQG